MKTVKFFTLGCKVNQYETQSLREQFINAGFKELEDSFPSDIYVINTCTVTHRADSDSFSLIRRAKRENHEAKIIVTGCLTELDEDKIKKIGGVNLIIKNKDKENILKFLSPYRKTNQHNQQTIPTNNGITYFKGHTRAFLKIQDGCDNLCSYCKVPLVRGISRSRPFDVIIQEAERLVKNDFKEIVLTGICLGTFGKDLRPKIKLMNVIEELEKIDGLLRIRLSSIEAKDVSDGLISKIAQSKKLCRHLHIPIQSGDDRILRRMNRKYSREDYLNLIKQIKSQIPEIAITTDILVGFPGENETNFQNTLNLVKEISPLKVHIFPYSRRAGTFAANNFRDEVKPLIIKERILRLQNIAFECSLTYKKQFLTKYMEVLIEGQPKDNPGLWVGYTDNYIKVLVKSEENLKNQFIRLRLSKIVGDFILADLC